MTSRSTFSSLARILSSVAFLAPLALPAACFEDQHTVGTDPDAGSDEDAGATGCENAVAPTCEEPDLLPGCTTGALVCKDGQYSCPPVVCVDAGESVDGGESVDAGSTSGSSFECGKAFCNSSTEYCSVVQGGAIEPDGGGNFGDTTCEAIPAACADDHAGAAATCACIASQVHGTCESSNGGDITVDIDVP